MNTEELKMALCDLNAIENNCWQRIVTAVTDLKHPFHHPAVANVNHLGANLRIVVLRAADSNKKELVFYTDVRSGKWHELNADSNASFLFYNPADNIQVRLSGKTYLHQTSAIADDAWEKCSLSSRKLYLGTAEPSRISADPTSGLPAEFDTEIPTPEQTAGGRKNFGVVVTKINWMEWVWLSRSGNRRAAFTYNADNIFTANWLVP